MTKRMVFVLTSVIIIWSITLTDVASGLANNAELFLNW